MFISFEWRPTTALLFAAKSVLEPANGILNFSSGLFGFAVDLKDEIVFGQVLDEGSFFVANDDWEVNEAGIDGDGRGSGGWGPVWGWVWGRGLLLRGEAGREDNASQNERPERAKSDHVELDDFRWAGFQLAPMRHILLLQKDSAPSVISLGKPWFGSERRIYKWNGVAGVISPVFVTFFTAGLARKCILAAR